MADTTPTHKTSPIVKTLAVAGGLLLGSTGVAFAHNAISGGSSPAAETATLSSSSTDDPTMSQSSGATDESTDSASDNNEGSGPKSDQSQSEDAHDQTMVRGTVASIGTDSFTITTADASTVIVTVSSTTTFVQPPAGDRSDDAGEDGANATFADVAVGDVVAVIGTAAPDGSVAARHVLIGVPPRDGAHDASESSDANESNDATESEPATHDANDDGSTSSSSSTSSTTNEGGDDGSSRGPGGGR